MKKDVQIKKASVNFLETYTVAFLGAVGNECIHPSIQVYIWKIKINR